jgi:hypothetical protein
MKFLLMLLLLAGLRYWMTSATKAPPVAVKSAPPGAVPKAFEPAKTLSPDLCPPIALQVGGKPIDVDVGHAAPFVADLGDGKLSLLVGQFAGGKLRAYSLEKTGDGYTPGEFTWVKAGTGECTVPSG